MSLLIVGLDTTIVNVALPSIGRELHTPVSGLQWTVDAYTLVLASLLMLSGSMADRFGRRRVFELGLVLFTLGSLLCSVAPSQGWLIVFRMLQAVGGSMLNPVAMSIIRNVFTDARERAQAIGMWGATVGISLALGPVVGGALVESVGWRSIFWINIPVGLLALALTMRFVPESRAPRPRRLDPVGQVLVIVLLGSLTYAIIEAPSAGWTSDQSIALFALAAAALVALVGVRVAGASSRCWNCASSAASPSPAPARSRSARSPRWAGSCSSTPSTCRRSADLSALTAGLYTLPIAAMTLVFAPLSGRLVGRRGPRVSLLVGGLGIMLGGALMTGLGAAHAARLAAARLLHLRDRLRHGQPADHQHRGARHAPAQAGVAAAVASTSRQVGQTLGVAVVGAVAAGGAFAVGAGLRRGQPHGLVDRRRLRPGGAGARPASARPPGRTPARGGSPMSLVGASARSGLSTSSPLGPEVRAVLGTVSRALWQAVPDDALAPVAFLWRSASRGRLRPRSPMDKTTAS